MGILLNRKTEEGRISRDYAPADSLEHQELRNLGRDSGVRMKGRREFNELMIDAQHKGFTREEVHEVMQTLIDKKLANPREARSIGTRLGLSGSALNFESHEREARHTAKNDLSKNNLNGKLAGGIGSRSSSHSARGHLY